MIPDEAKEKTLLALGHVCAYLKDQGLVKQLAALNQCSAALHHISYSLLNDSLVFETDQQFVTFNDCLHPYYVAAHDSTTAAEIDGYMDQAANSGRGQRNPLLDWRRTALHRSCKSLHISNFATELYTARRFYQLLSGMKDTIFPNLEVFASHMPRWDRTAHQPAEILRDIQSQSKTDDWARVVPPYDDLEETLAGCSVFGEYTDVFWRDHFLAVLGPVSTIKLTGASKKPLAVVLPSLTLAFGCLALKELEYTPELDATQGLSTAALAGMLITFVRNRIEQHAKNPSKPLPRLRVRLSLPDEELQGIMTSMDERFWKEWPAWDNVKTTLAEASSWWQEPDLRRDIFTLESIAA